MPVPSTRVDAAEHRALLLDAALTVFQRHGTKAPLDLIVQRAGVGRATLYRNFADRDALLATLLDQAIGEIKAEAHALADRDTGLFDLLHFMCDSIPKYAPLIEYVDALDRADPKLVASRATFARIFEPLLRTAIAKKQCADDLQPLDMVSVCSMLGAAYRAVPLDERQQSSQRALQLLLRGLQSMPQKRSSSKR